MEHYLIKKALDGGYDYIGPFVKREDAIAIMLERGGFVATTPKRMPPDFKGRLTPPPAH